LYPTTTDVLAVQERSTRCDPPASVIVVGELLALLAIVTLPVALPVDVGVRLTVNVTDCPAVKVVFDATPLALYPDPEAVTCEMVTLEFPVFVSVTFCELVLPTVTFPKLKLVGVALKTSVAVAPVPLSGMVVGEVGALLDRLIVPLALPLALGANSALKVLLVPGFIVIGTLSPVILNPVPDTLAWLIVRLAVPGLFKLIVCVLLLPVATLPKLTVDGVAEICG